MNHTPLEETHPPMKRPEDTAIGQAMFRAIGQSMYRAICRRNDDIKPTTDGKPVRTIAAVATVVEVVDFYPRKK
jgi:hypothetical protein